MLLDKLCERYNKDPAKCKAICRRIGLRFVITVLVLIIILLNLIWFNLIKAFDLTKPKPRLLSVSDDQQGYYNMFLKNSKKYDSKVMLYRDKSQQWLNMLEHNHDFHYDPDTMTLLNENFYALNCFKFQPYIANGYIGSKISNLGFGFTYDQNVPNIENGWPLRNQRYTGSYISDFYSLQEKLNSTNFPELDDLGYSTVISSIPYWNDMIIEFDDEEYESFINKRILKPSSLESLNPAHFREYKQLLSMKNGIIKTSYIWMDSIKIEIECFANKKYHSMSSISINIEVLNKTRVKNLKIINLLDFKTSERTELIDLGHKINSSTTGTTTSQDSESELIYMVVSPENVHEYSNAAIISKLMFPSYMTKNKDYSIQYKTNGNEPDCIEQIVSLTNPDLEKFEIFKLVSIHSTELTNSLQNLEISLKELNNHKTIQDYYHLKNIHINRWFDFYSMNCFIEIPSDILLELSIRSSIFHLISNLREDNVLPNRGLPVSPSGLSSDSYGGMVFWDSDYWIVPAMIPFFPKAAKNMIMYRNATLPQAIENANFYNQSGAIYPWTAGRYSNCTSTGPCIDYEYHINIDIVWSSFLYYMSGNYDMNNDQFDDETYLRYTLWPLVYQVTTYFENYVTYDSINDQFTTKNLTDPDEFANFIDNGAYTNFGIKMLFVWAIDIGRHLEIPFPKKWFDIREKMYIPENSQGDITLEYTGMNSTIRTKQADVLLNIYPFGIFHKFPNYQKSVNNLYFYTEHQAYDGPAMSYQIYVAVANYLLNQGCSSQSFLYKSLIPYLRLPWAQFSEQANDLDPLTKPAFPFLTANGGFLQSIIYGITGIRFNYEVDKKTKKISRFMEFNPIQLKVLPGGISIKNFKYMNGILDIIIGDEKAILKYKFGKSPITIKVPDRNKLHILDGTVNSIEIFKTYKLRPNTQLELDLFPVESNMKDDVAECKLITNLTVGVPGDVAISLIDGNNYTHWQAIDHNRATFLIDIGSNNEKVINSATILWGNRPAKNVSVYILPMDDFNYDEIPFFFTPTNLSVYDSAYDDWNDDNTLMDQKINQLEVMIAMGAFTEKDLMKWFIPLVEGQEVVPSVPYNKYDTTNDDIKISKNNETTILFDYDCDVIPKDSVFGKHNPAKKPLHRQFDCNDLSKYKARFILVSVEGVYGYDDQDDDYLNDKEIPVIETFGATIREIALF